jgi:fatty acid desaturase
MSVATAELDGALAALRKDEVNVALPGLALAYALLVALFLSPAFVHAPWIFALIWVPLGILQYRVVISGHEAVHKTLCFPLWLNELLGVFGQALVGVNFAAYRLQHLDHHRARTLDEDPDGHIYGGIIKTPRGARRIAVWTLGTLVEILVKIRQKGTGGYGTLRDQRPDEVRQRRMHTLYVILAQLTIMTSAAAVLSQNLGVALVPTSFALAPLVQTAALMVGGYALLWTGPLFTVAVFLNRSRILIEHGLALLINDETPGAISGPRIPTVDIVPNVIERVIFSPFLFNYHCCHHLYMTVPHYNLPKVRELCRAHGVKGYHEVQGSYLSALRRAMSA